MERLGRVDQAHTITPIGGGAAVPMPALETSPQIDIDVYRYTEDQDGKKFTFDSDTGSQMVGDITFGGTVKMNDDKTARVAGNSYDAIGNIYANNPVRTYTRNYGGGLSIALKIKFQNRRVISPQAAGDPLKWEAVAFLAAGEADAVVITGS